MSDNKITKEMLLALVDDLTIDQKNKDELINLVENNSIEEVAEKLFPLLEQEIALEDKKIEEVEEEYQKEIEEIEKKAKAIEKKADEDFDEEYEKKYGKLEKQIELLEELEEKADKKADDVIDQGIKKLDEAEAKIIKELENNKIEKIRGDLQ
jgi:DNA anti-recombination protein RmuC